MAQVLDLSRRSQLGELMDDPGLAPEALRAALGEVGRLNALSGTTGTLFRRLLPLVRERGRADGPVRVLDIACGGGDVALALGERAARAGARLEVDGCDLSEEAVGHAAEQADRRGLRARFFPLDCVQGPIPGGYDAITSTLFLHHLDVDSAVTMLGRCASSGARLVLASDLVRSRAGYLLARVATRVFARSPIVHADGPRSVERAYTIEEARELTRDAGLEGARVTSSFPCRLLLEWTRP